MWVFPWKYFKDWCWSWSDNLLVTLWKELTHWKRLWCWKRLKAKGEGVGRDLNCFTKNNGRYIIFCLLILIYSIQLKLLSKDIPNSIKLFFSGNHFLSIVVKTLNIIGWLWRYIYIYSNNYSGLISFMIDWFDLLSAQGTLKSLLQHHNSKALVLQLSIYFMVQLLHLYMITGKTITLNILTFVGKVMSLFF